MPGQLLQFAGQLLGLAAEHLLLPAIGSPHGVFLVALLPRQLFLAPCQLLQFAQRLLHLGVVLAALHLVEGLVLVLAGVEFEREQVGKVAAGAAAAAAPASLIAEGHLNILEQRLGAQQILQRGLLRSQRLLKFLSFQSRRGRLHGLHRFLKVFVQTGELIVDAVELAPSDAARQRLGLLLELALHLREHLGGLVELLRLLTVLLPQDVPGGRDHFFLPLGEERAFVSLSAPAAPGALALRVGALERAHLQEKHFGRGGVCRRVLGRAVVGDQIAGRKRILFERQQMCRRGLLSARLRYQRHRLYLAAIDRVVQTEVGEAHIVLAFESDHDFFNGSRLHVMARPREFHRGSKILDGLHQIFFARPRFAATRVLQADVVEGILRERPLCLQLAVAGLGEFNRAFVIEREPPARGGGIGMHRERDFGAFELDNVAARLLYLVGAAGIGRVVIANLQPVDPRHRDYRDGVLGRADAVRFHVVVNLLLHVHQQKMEISSAFCRHHRSRFPARAFFVLDEQAHLLRQEPDRLGGNLLVGVAPDRNVSRRNLNQVQRSRFGLRPSHPQRFGAVTEDAGAE